MMLDYNATKQCTRNHFTDGPLLSWPPSTACGPRLSQLLRLETDVHPVPKHVKDPGECEIEPGRRRLLLAAELVQCAKVTACLALWGPAYRLPFCSL
ncbi:hypothetical protein MHYP_G00079420 [Metynnis hypsauchen]